jgi:hypothetical protein
VSASDLAEPGTRLDRALALIPRALSSHAHIVFLLGLLVYLVLLPLSHLYTPNSTDMLIGGNWTNVTGDIGACVAAGGTLHLVRQQRKRNKAVADTHRIIADLYRHATGSEHEAAPPPA